MKTILLTGSSGFIGFHLAKKLLDNNYHVIGVDNMNPYYDVNLKKDRLKILEKEANFTFYKYDISNIALVEYFKETKFEYIINLAAQAGVQYSSKDPHSYISSNVMGFLNILELARKKNIAHLIYASSSSVYGLNEKIPFKESHNVNHPISLYAATKRSNELMAHTYSHLFSLPTTGLRFFTVYGPWGRPDMALFKFTESLVKGKPITVNNYGEHYRDFTYIEDIVEGIYSIINKIPQPNNNNSLNAPDFSSAPWSILNIGRGQKVHLMDFIKNLEKYFNKKFELDLVPLQPGDVETTFSSTSKLTDLSGYSPSVNVEDGIKLFLDWYVDYYKISLPL